MSSSSSTHRKDTSQQLDFTPLDCSALFSGAGAVLAAAVTFVALCVIFTAHLYTWTGLTTGVTAVGQANCLAVAKWSALAFGGLTIMSIASCCLGGCRKSSSNDSFEE